MAVTAWKICSTAVNYDHDGDIGGAQFTNPSNVTADDNTDALTRNFSGAVPIGTDYLLKCSGLGFTSSDVGLTDTITGIEVRIGGAWRSSGTVSIVDSRLQLIDETGVLVGSNISTGSLISLTGSRTNFDVGGSSNLWGWASLTPAKLHNVNTGVAILLINTGFAMGVQQGAIDYVAMRAHFNPSGVVNTRRTRSMFIM